VKLDSKLDKLDASNRSYVDNRASNFGKDQTFTPLLQLLADVLDSAASGSDCYAVIGTNRDKSALLLSIKQDGKTGYLSAATIWELSEACKTVL